MTKEGNPDEITSTTCPLSPLPGGGGGGDGGKVDWLASEDTRYERIFTGTMLAAGDRKPPHPSVQAVEVSLHSCSVHTVHYYLHSLPLDGKPVFDVR